MTAFMVPMFAVVEAEDAEGAVAQAQELQAASATDQHVPLYLDEWLDPKECENQEVHSILDVYDEKELYDLSTDALVLGRRNR